MSRSYKKFASCESHEFDSMAGEKSAKQRYLHKELYANEYGDAVFPQYTNHGERTGYTLPDFSKKAILNRYFTEIRNILNGYSDRYKDYQEDFKDLRIWFAGQMKINKQNNGGYMNGNKTQMNSESDILLRRIEAGLEQAEPDYAKAESDLKKAILMKREEYHNAGLDDALPLFDLFLDTLKRIHTE
jgi:hypothetical protein